MLNYTALALTVFAGTLFPASFSTLKKSPKNVSSHFNSKPRVQVALLLDVSNSMDGLINQAKDQLWGLLKVVSKVRCSDGQAPSVEVALYEYGRPENGAENGFIKQIQPFTKDLEQLNISLYSLTTHGGDEYCGHVLKKALDELTWDTSKASYKTIFIAGNESFLQGSVNYQQACETAIQKGVIINTIFCGEIEEGNNQNWNLGSSCGNGSFSNINKDAVPKVISTPYDSSLFVLNGKLRKTRIPFGKVADFDTVYMYDVKSIDKVIGITVVRSDPNMPGYFRSDLVDAVRRDSSLLDKISPNDLPDSLKGKPRNYLSQLVYNKQAEREQVRKMVIELDQLRDAFILKEKKAGNFPATLLDVIENIIRQQIRHFGLSIIGEKKAF